MHPALLLCTHVVCGCSNNRMGERLVSNAQGHLCRSLLAQVLGTSDEILLLDIYIASVGNRAALKSDLGYLEPRLAAFEERNLLVTRNKTFRINKNRKEADLSSKAWW